jgi:sarcosine oxidase subunit alpha
VFATGGVVGDGSTEVIVAHGRATGQAAAHHALGLPGTVVVPAFAPAPHPSLFLGQTKGIVDYSEDISSKDLVAAANEGYDSVELLKRYTTATMGPAQGKLETINTVAVLAAANRTHDRGHRHDGLAAPTRADHALVRSRAAALEPVRYSPMQPWHDSPTELTPIVAGLWIRPEHYGDAAAEVHNVRRERGASSMSPRSARSTCAVRTSPKLLNFLYVNKWSKLDIGSVRYGVMCNEDGVVLDDGVTGHLG